MISHSQIKPRKENSYEKLAKTFGFDFSVGKIQSFERPQIYPVINDLLEELEDHNDDFFEEKEIPKSEDVINILSTPKPSLQSTQESKFLEQQNQILPESSEEKIEQDSANFLSNKKTRRKQNKIKNDKKFEIEVG